MDRQYQALLVLFVGLLLMSETASPVSGKKYFQQKLTGLLYKVQQFIANLTHLSGQTEFMGNDCFYTVGPKTEKAYDVVFKSKFWCPNLVPYAGRATSRVHNGAMGSATSDFAKKLVRNGIYTKEELHIWL